MKSFSLLFFSLLLAVAGAGCWVPELPENAIFRCDTNEDCADSALVCAPREGLSGFCCRPIPEECNGVDDDCDGLTDEDFNLQTDNAHCGQCNNACSDGKVCADGACR
ncbi:MAG TPA: hypothetical protein VLQ93_24225 [Myxococcaceae bacterium]|nr:hypothetical protein [Myxococcaceae bacterium]